MRVTAESRGSLAVQVEGQPMPPPETLPFPLTPTVSDFVALDETQAAVTWALPWRRTVQDAPPPLHAPPQPLNASPDPGVWNRVRVEPVSTVQLQAVAGVAPSVPQSSDVPGGACSGAVTKPTPFVES